MSCTLAMVVFFRMKSMPATFASMRAPELPRLENASKTSARKFVP